MVYVSLLSERHSPKKCVRKQWVFRGPSRVQEFFVLQKTRGYNLQGIVGVCFNGALLGEDCVRHGK